MISLIDSSEPQIFIPASNEDSKRLSVKREFPCKNTANNYEVTDYIDLTKEDQCFICDRVISSTFYSLAKTMTTRSKNLIVHKLGKLAGKRCLIIVSEDDYICQNCVNLFNQLESAEIQLKIAKNCIKKHLNQKYLSSDKIRTVPNDVYAAFDLLVTKNTEKSKEYVKSKSIIKKEVCSNNLDIHNKYLMDLSFQTISNHQFDYSVSNIENHPENFNKVVCYDESNSDKCSSNSLQNDLFKSNFIQKSKNENNNYSKIKKFEIV